MVKGEQPETRTGLNDMPVKVEVEVENPIGIPPTRLSQLTESRVEGLEMPHQLEAE
jgi:hypothetical protein